MTRRCGQRDSDGFPKKGLRSKSTPLELAAVFCYFTVQLPCPEELWQPPTHWADAPLPPSPQMALFPLPPALHCPVLFGQHQRQNRRILKRLAEADAAKKKPRAVKRRGFMRVT
jgi:hypothetical protein